MLKSKISDGEPKAKLQCCIQISQTLNLIASNKNSLIVIINFEKKEEKKRKAR